MGPKYIISSPYDLFKKRTVKTRYGLFVFVFLFRVNNKTEAEFSLIRKKKTNQIRKVGLQGFLGGVSTCA